MRISFKDNTDGNLASLFECPVCFDYVLPPIYQCRSGHLVCSNCRANLKSCPSCRGPLENIRNLVMEKVANTVMFPCKFNSSGCAKAFPPKEKVDHEKICEFRPYPCPCPAASCKWQGTLDQVIVHLLSAHKSITTLEGEDIVFLATDINLQGNVDWVMMQNCFGCHFILVLEKQERTQFTAAGDSVANTLHPNNALPNSINPTATALTTLHNNGTSHHHHHHTGATNNNNTTTTTAQTNASSYFYQYFAVVQLVGSAKQAENFVYKLELNGNHRRLTWESRTRSIQEGLASAIASSDCLVFDSGVAAIFAENGNLGINVTISM